MNDRRTLFVKKEDIPSSAKEVTTENYSTLTGTVVYIPLYNNNKDINPEDSTDYTYFPRSYKYANVDVTILSVSGNTFYCYLGYGTSTCFTTSGSSYYVSCPFDQYANGSSYKGVPSVLGIGTTVSTSSSGQHVIFPFRASPYYSGDNLQRITPLVYYPNCYVRVRFSAAAKIVIDPSRGCNWTYPMYIGNQ